MARKLWKDAESKVAQAFGTKRQPLSGQGGRTGSRSDTKHSRLFIENKQGAYIPLWTLFNEIKDRAKQENKIPVITLCQKGDPGFLLVFNSQHFASVVKEFFAANHIHVTVETDRRITPNEPEFYGPNDLHSFKGTLKELQTIVDSLVDQYGENQRISLPPNSYNEPLLED